MFIYTDLVNFYTSPTFIYPSLHSQEFSIRFFFPRFTVTELAAQKNVRFFFLNGDGIIHLDMAPMRF